MFLVIAHVNVYIFNGASVAVCSPDFAICLHLLQFVAHNLQFAYCTIHTEMDYCTQNGKMCDL